MQVKLEYCYIVKEVDVREIEIPFLIKLNRMSNNLLLLTATGKNRVIFALEHLCCLAALKILPFSFGINLLIYYLCNSRTVADLYS
jgi:hypothetical protein